MPKTDYAYRELFVCWASPWDGPDGEDGFWSHDHGSEVDCDWGWICNGTADDGTSCQVRVDFTACPEHALREYPGLRMAECDAMPRHELFVFDRDDYGHGCPKCWSNQLAARIRELEIAAHSHGWWRRGRTGRWLARTLRRCGLIKDYGYACGAGCNGCYTWVWRWRR